MTHKDGNNRYFKIWLSQLLLSYAINKQQQRNKKKANKSQFILEKHEKIMKTLKIVMKTLIILMKMTVVWFFFSNASELHFLVQNLNPNMCLCLCLDDAHSDTITSASWSLVWRLSDDQCLQELKKQNENHWRLWKLSYWNKSRSVT